MRVSFVEQRLSDDAESQPRILVGPVTFTTRDVVEPGYVLGYEMLFRNLSAECGCIPKCPASLGSVANRLTDALNPVSARHHIAVSPVPRSPRATMASRDAVRRSNLSWPSFSAATISFGQCRR